MCQMSEVNHSHLSSADIKNEWSHNSTPSIFFRGVKENFTFFTYFHLCLGLVCDLFMFTSQTEHPKYRFFSAPKW
jgi:hypothetical protein